MASIALDANFPIPSRPMRDSDREPAAIDLAATSLPKKLDADSLPLRLLLDQCHSFASLLLLE